ncbi:hypothetical protein E3A20_06510 [Planctomyces bekefii]|uniref:Peptidase M14 domain-containing protein n=1 Tax=Planctomyces bekefii TaxID=1653850 RepID=A0A5C6MCC3_9PLAN|nr:hypothetical protein E3A20_06510 [Planctomyces bekefii]
MDFQDFRTIAEATDWQETGRYSELIKISEAFAERFPALFRLERLGTTPEGRPLIAWIVGKHQTPEGAKAANQSVLLFQGGIHPGEIEGKDAIIGFVKELLFEKKHGNLLQDLTLLFVPVLNVDGHERMGAYNRPNQNGPKEMGWRANALNLNLNRDYIKAESPEMQAFLPFLKAWDPLVYTDMHATNGADFETDLSLLIDPADFGPEPLKPVAAQLSQELIQSLSERGHITVPFYPTLRLEDRPESGFELAPLSPRYSQGYQGARNRLGILVETHSWRPYKHRVKTCADIIEIVCQMAVKRGSNWREKAHAVDAMGGTIRGQDVALTCKASDQFTMIDFKGYEYSYEYSPISGAPWVRYHRDKKQIWRVPYYGDLRTDVAVQVPRQGYIVPAPWAPLVQEKLALHGIEWQPLPEKAPVESLLSFRPSKFQMSPESFEGRQMLKVQGNWQKEPKSIGAGALFVPIAQPKWRLVLFLLEPTSPDSLLSWGFFNAAFERKEYMEAYVTEAYARELLQDTDIKKSFEARLASDPAFAASAKARLDFFYERHPAWDKNYGLYPILKWDEA